MFTVFDNYGREVGTYEHLAEAEDACPHYGWIEDDNGWVVNA